MTDQERAALIAWLEARILEWEDQMERYRQMRDKEAIARFELEWEKNRLIAGGKWSALKMVKAHIESEAAHDEA